MPSLSEIMQAMPTATQYDARAMAQQAELAGLEATTQGQLIQNQANQAKLDEYNANAENREMMRQVEAMKLQFQNTPEYKQMFSSAEMKKMQNALSTEEKKEISDVLAAGDPIFARAAQGDMLGASKMLEQILPQSPILQRYFQSPEGQSQLQDLAEGGVEANVRFANGWEMMKNVVGFGADASKAALKHQRELEKIRVEEQEKRKTAETKSNDKGAGKLTPVYLGEAQQKELANALLAQAEISDFFGGISENQQKMFKANLLSAAKTKVRAAANQGIEMDHATAINEIFTKMAEGFKEGWIFGDYNNEESAGTTEAALPSGMTQGMLDAYLQKNKGKTRADAISAFKRARSQ